MSRIFHGGGLDAAIAGYGGKRSDWLDLSTGINPNPYPVTPFANEDWTRLPDSGAQQELLEAARSYYRVPGMFGLVPANGTQALIQLLPSLLGLKRAAVVSPTYQEHAHVWQSAGAAVSEIPGLADVPDRTEALAVVNPNNPDGRMIEPEMLVQAAGRVSCLVVDEAFCDVVHELSVVPIMPDNAIVLKSFGKFFGLAGIRLGFAICKPSWAETLRRMIGPWAVSGPALKLGSRALRDTKWIVQTRADLGTGSARLVGTLSDAGMEIAGTNALFVQVHHGRAQSLNKHLLEHRILVRPFPERAGFLRFGLPADDSGFERLEAALRMFGDS